ncbi:competence/damage-inducible protein A [Salimicrobium jeotgali]|uniref:Putative competence-damage inducible protein n=1 Tax=Salimicrobium jeotgali TaxID=1230341 RepID=K2GCL2_9BACI|nr:competence/damage-inducible protein A [Salimicrobium jeotgali]AKG04522.1 competence/damage-inducible protein A [Salimicrobium jeotgali]EKE32733.1 putative competence damage-inducible protein [Salimicrobium jeotgali]MBM7695279.1 nicotinamide-nucleotide amidase [Salimicrobium jeotgali]
MTQWKSEIIGVGTELLLGQIANTNAQWISEQLAFHGISVYYHTAAGDNQDRLAALFRTAQERSNLIIVTGGLGPTEDDLTKEAVNTLFRRPFRTDETAKEKIENFYKKNRQSMTSNNYKQAQVFEQAHILTNEEGMAPGQIVEHEGRVWVFLPGVPVEMKQLMRDGVFPYLRERYVLSTEIKSEMLRFIGIGESALEDLLSERISNQTNPTIAPLASLGEVGVRLTASGASLEEADDLLAKERERILEIVGDYYYGSDDITIEQKVFELLKERGWTISAAESLTGGQFINQMISLPGASGVCTGGMVSYTKEAKEKALGVSPYVTNRYGTISAECAEAMAERAQHIFNSNVGISFTGVAGPSKSENQDPGSVYIGVKIGEDRAWHRFIHLQGSREQVQNKAVKKAYQLLFHTLNNGV